MKKFIPNRQIFMILYCIISGYGVINLPKRTAESAGTGGWVSILIATVVLIFITYMITYLQYVYEGKTLYDYSQQLVGKFLTYVFIVIYILYFFIFFTMVTRIYCDTIKLSILTKTPVIYLCIFVYIVVGYALLNGINAIARLCEIYGFISIISIIFISSVIFSQGEIVHIRPLFVADNILVYLKAVTRMVLPFLGVEIMLAIPVSRNANKNIYNYTIILTGFMGILFIYIVEAAYSIGGLDLVVNSKATLFSIAKGVDVPYLEFFRRPDGIYIIAWTINVVCAVSMWGYGTTTFINKMLKRTKYKLIVIITTILSFIVSQLPKTMDEVQSILEYNAYLGFVVLFIIPCILLLITKVKKYDKKLL